MVHQKIARITCSEQEGNKPTPRTAGSSWTLVASGGPESSTARSFTSDARNTIYAKGSGLGGAYSSGGLQVGRSESNLKDWRVEPTPYRRVSVPM